MNDISERKHAEEQLRHAQKMECVGRLAGGVAHDFNNILTVVLAHGELMAETLGGDPAALESIVEIRQAAQRGAGLTRQLLAFSRKQVIEPRVLDLNALIRDTERMLTQLLGEDITLTSTLDPAIGRINVDA